MELAWRDMCVCVSDGRVCHGCMHGAHDVCALTKSVLHTDSSDETECRCRQLRICSEVSRPHLVLAIIAFIDLSLATGYVAAYSRGPR